MKMWGWYESAEKLSHEDRILEGAEAYEEAHGEAPNLCHVHEDVEVDLEKVGKILIVKQPNMLRNLYLLGMQSCSNCAHADEHRPEVGPCFSGPSGWCKNYDPELDN